MENNLKNEQVVEIAQRCFQRFPTIILGSGASIPYGLPSMAELRKCLICEIESITNSDNSWKDISSIIADHRNLEEALDKLDICEIKFSKITEWIWNIIDKSTIIDISKYYNNGYNIGDLLFEMFESNNRQAHVITTNYDLVVESICCLKGLQFRTGFSQVNIKNRKQNNGQKEHLMPYSSGIVNIHKVHGSVDWFRTVDNQIINITTSKNVPSQFTPLIVAPGIKKYQRTHQEPFRTVIKNADTAIGMSNSFLCVGFGFRDEHIHPKIKNICKDRNIPIVIIAQCLTDEAMKFLQEDAGRNYMGIEEYENGCKVYTPKSPDGDYIDVPELWSLSGFCSMVLQRKDGECPGRC